MGRVGIVAGLSLGLSDEQTTDALNALAGFRPSDATTGTMYARMLELVDLARGEGLDGLPHDLDTKAERAKLERSFGAGFIKRVAAMGQPAGSTLAALRSLLLAFVVLLWASLGNATQRAGAPVVGSHKIQRRNRRRRKLGRRSQPVYSHPRGWIRSSQKSVDSPRLSTFFPSFATGFECEPASSRSRTRSSKSSWFGAVDGSMSAGCPRVTPTSPSSGVTARSNSLRTFDARGLR
jgi:hypothetical protein